MMSLIVMFGIAFVFIILFVYCGISILSNLVFGFLGWRIKRRYVNEMLKELAVLPLQWKEEKLQKWYVLLAIIVCGLIWMPSFVTLGQVNGVNIPELNRDVVNVTPTPTISEKYGIPEPYYLDVGERGKNISELREALKEIKHLQEYEANVYDCSEMSAWSEHCLENQGFNVSILSNKKHAWIIVHGLADQAAVHVECTRVPPSITNYRNYSRRYDDIYAACGRNTNTSCPAWDWWSK